MLAVEGIGSGAASVEQCVELASRPQVLQNWRRCRHLVIAEISMIDGQLFEKLEVVARLMPNLSTNSTPNRPQYCTG